jgi:hypothetical protein
MSDGLRGVIKNKQKMENWRPKGTVIANSELRDCLRVGCSLSILRQRSHRSKPLSKHGEGWQKMFLRSIFAA